MGERETSAQDDDASPLELFFDLVFVVSLALLTKFFLKHLTFEGAAQTMILLIAFYAVWSATTFAALLPEVRRGPAQWVVLAVMLFVLFMAIAIDSAWNDAAWWFVVPYLACRAGHGVAALALNSTPAARAYQRAALMWAGASSPLWIAGALVGDGARPVLWASAAAIDLAGAWWAHPMPRPLRAAHPLEFDADRLVERCRLFLLVVLGETLLTTGLGLADAPREPATVAAGALSFVCVVALWLVYFGSSDHHVERDLDRAGNAQGLARRVLAGQVFVAAGLVTLAAGLDEVIAHPGSESGAVALTLTGGPVLYVLVQAWYLEQVAGGRPWKRLLGVGSLVALCPVLLLVPALAALAAVALVLVVQAAATLRGAGAVG